MRVVAELELEVEDDFVAALRIGGNNERAVRHAEWWEGWRGSDHAAANEWGAEHALALAAGVVAVRVVTS